MWKNKYFIIILIGIFSMGFWGNGYNRTMIKPFPYKRITNFQELDRWISEITDRINLSNSVMLYTLPDTTFLNTIDLDDISAGDTNVHLTTTLKSNYDSAYANRLISASGTLPLTLTLSNNILSGSIPQANDSTNGYMDSTIYNKASSAYTVSTTFVSSSTNGIVDSTSWNLIPTILKGSVVPTSTPAKAGNIYLDTTAKKVYISTGTTDSTDWNLLN